ncbi:ABC transporter ATP-binding protein [Aeribacillus sp. FSL K6-2833]|uniref:ABC transporter ATP-binding protein n=1 Tax=Aeribacillus sp. FSL K6-2833 TaxID=2954611 RepID=UPI0030D7C021
MTDKIQFDHVTKIFKIRDVEKGKGSFKEFTALRNVHFSIKNGEFLTLVGPSGCGKSTLLDLLGGLSQPTSGKILIDGKQIDGPGLDRAIVFQQYALFPWKTAKGNIEFGLKAKGVPKKERSEIARHFLEIVGLSGFEERYPHELSGGMKQRVAIARSLAFDPDVLLMDEPFAALDAQTRETLQNELLRIWEKTKKTIVFITHGIDEAVYLGQRIAVMTSRPGTIKQIITNSAHSQAKEDDARSTPEFVKTRHQIWDLLRDEVSKSQNDHKKEHSA